MDAWAGITVAGGDISGISLASNLLTGKMPQSIGTLTALTALVVNDNQVTGSLPTSIGNLIKLTNLRLSENNLTGSIPSTIGNLTKLTYLSFYRNVNLTGTLPVSFYNLVNLVNLYIFDTQIGGSLSEQIGGLRSWLNSGDITISLQGLYPPRLGASRHSRICTCTTIILVAIFHRTGRTLRRFKTYGFIIMPILPASFLHGSETSPAS